MQSERVNEACMCECVNSSLPVSICRKKKKKTNSPQRNVNNGGEEYVSNFRVSLCVASQGAESRCDISLESLLVC